MWPFKEPFVAIDNTEFIYLDETGTRFYPLMCDNTLYKESLEIIREQLRTWIVQDLSYTTSLNEVVERSLVYQLVNIDVKFLPYPTYTEMLKLCLQDTDISHSGSRLMDTIVRIGTLVPTEVLETIKGKFLYSMLYTIPREVNGQPMPNKVAWVETLSLYPWIPLMLFIQELYEADDIVDKVTKLTAKLRVHNTQVEAPKITMDVK